MCEQKPSGCNARIMAGIQQRDSTEPHGPSPDFRTPAQIEFDSAWAYIQANVPEHLRLSTQDALRAEFRVKYPSHSW